MMGDEALHRAHAVGRDVRIGPAGNVVRKHRERRLQAMGEIADMVAGALHDGAVVLEQRIGFGDNRLEFDVLRIRQPLGAAFADIGDLAAQRVERAQAVEDLQEHGEDQADAEDEERDGERRDDAAERVLDLGLGTRDRDAQVRAAARRREVAVERMEFAAARADEFEDMAGLPDLADGRAEVRIPQRRALEEDCIGIGDLPVPARIELLVLRLGDDAARLQRAGRIEGDRAHDGENSARSAARRNCARRSRAGARR